MFSYGCGSDRFARPSRSRRTSSAQRAGLQRVHVARLETGALKCRMVATRRSLANAYRVPLGDLDDYLKGKIEFEAFLARRAAALAEPATAVLLPAPVKAEAPRHPGD